MSIHRYSFPTVVVSLLLLLILTPALADDYEDAVRLLKQGNSAAALKKADAAIAANKDDARPRFLKGLILAEQDKTAQAIEVFTSLTRDYPELPEPYNNLAVLYAAQGNYERARESLEMAIRTHPSYAVAHENLGDVYAKMASEAYDKALSLDRSNQTAQAKLSLIRELFSRTESIARVKPAAVPNTKPPKTVSPPPSPSASAKPAQGQDLAVIAAVGNWAEAWSNQDVKAYLSHYAPGFNTPGEQSRIDWEKVRRSRIQRPKFIKVAISEPQVSFTGERSATVRFRQHYQSDTIDSTGYKTLTMEKSDQGWLIIREQFEN